jgi:polyphosphate kinase
MMTEVSALRIIEPNKPSDTDVQKSFDNSHFTNREISQLSFNARVLEQAVDVNHPLLERLKFLLIFSSNLDEYFEVRVAKLKLQILLGREHIGPDGLSPIALLKRISEQCHELIDKQYNLLNNELLPALEKENIFFVARENWNDDQKVWIKEYFKNEVAPIITPIALDPAHPFPKLVNKSLNFIVSLKGKDAFGRESRLAIVPAPRALPRLIKLPKFGEQEKDQFVFLSAIIHENVDSFFNGMKATGCYQFRVTRNSDLEVDDKKTDDIADEVKGKLFNRRFGDAVRLEVVENCPEDISDFLLNEYGLSKAELYPCNGPVNLMRLFAVLSEIDRPHLYYPEFSPEYPQGLTAKNNLFESIKNKDYLLLHPFSSFSPVLDLLRQAAADPQVISIKQTLYRVGLDSEIVSLLEEAARNGKEVMVVIELKARFDEKENLILASRMQEAGIVVCYGVVGYKTHAKMMVVLRKEKDKLCHYVHLGTGNYHVKNARIYTDYSLFTSNPEICEDVHHIFQQLTGMGKTLTMNHLVNAPFTLRKKISKLIDGEIDAAAQGKPARIIIKVNGLTDKQVIEKLYHASQAGVKIDLIVRSMCSLKPGLKGISENIRVKSIIGRFLEHNRVFYFENAEHPVYCGSADLMARNLTRRIEVCFPLLSPKLTARVKKDLERYIKDKGQSWILDSEGNYHREVSVGDIAAVQLTLLNQHCEVAIE